ncbi:hypothetical protein J6590_026013 [Homalodisca vitripennis]|nr:hypothetical protein J6590_026013 [Homalodisca vitripennis]
MPEIIVGTSVEAPTVTGVTSVSLQRPEKSSTSLARVLGFGIGFDYIECRQYEVLVCQVFWTVAAYNQRIIAEGGHALLVTATSGMLFGIQLNCTS